VIFGWRFRKESRISESFFLIPSGQQTCSMDLFREVWMEFFLK